MPLVASDFGSYGRPIFFPKATRLDLSRTPKETTGSGDQNAADPAASRQIQSKIDLREVLWARETEQPLQTVVFTNTAGHKTSPGSMLHCHNPASQAASQSHRRGKKYNTGTQGKQRVDRGKISVNTKKSVCYLNVTKSFLDFSLTFKNFSFFPRLFLTLATLPGNEVNR